MVLSMTLRCLAASVGGGAAAKAEAGGCAVSAGVKDESEGAVGGGADPKLEEAEVNLFSSYHPKLLVAVAKAGGACRAYSDCSLCIFSSEPLNIGTLYGG